MGCRGWGYGFGDSGAGAKGEGGLVCSRGVAGAAAGGWHVVGSVILEAIERNCILVVSLNIVLFVMDNDNWGEVDELVRIGLWGNDVIRIVAPATAITVAGYGI